MTIPDDRYFVVWRGRADPPRTAWGTNPAYFSGGPVSYETATQSAMSLRDMFPSSMTFRVCRMPFGLRLKPGDKLDFRTVRNLMVPDWNPTENHPQ